MLLFLTWDNEEFSTDKGDLSQEGFPTPLWHNDHIIGHYFSLGPLGMA